MCDRCDDLDYPVADCWRPCYVPPRRSSTRIPLRRGGISDEDIEAQVRITTLLATIRAQRTEIAVLKAAQTHTDSRESFEGVE